MSRTILLDVLFLGGAGVEVGLDIRILGSIFSIWGSILRMGLGPIGPLESMPFLGGQILDLTRFGLRFYQKNAQNRSNSHKKLPE